MPGIHSLAKIWDEESLSYKFSNDKQPDYRADFYYLEKSLGDIVNKKILEVGSGTGQASAYLASKGGVVHLLDISKRSLEFSRKYFKEKKLPVKLFHQDAFNIKLPESSFDFVWNGGVIEHFSDKDKVQMFRNMWKLVKPGGKLVITAPNSRDIPFMLAKRILQLRNKWSFGEEDDLTRKRMQNLAKAAGLTNFSIFAYNPIVGWWFFPYGREITNFFGLNTLKHHEVITSIGHTLILCAEKPVAQ